MLKKVGIDLLWNMDMKYGYVVTYLQPPSLACINQAYSYPNEIHNSLATQILAFHPIKSLSRYHPPTPLSGKYLHMNEEKAREEGILVIRTHLNWLVCMNGYRKWALSDKRGHVVITCFGRGGGRLVIGRAWVGLRGSPI